MTRRRQIIDLLASGPRTASSLARELGLRRRDIDDELPHVVRSARAAGHEIVVEPARCRACGFTFGTETLHKPSKCPQCRATRFAEPMIRVER